MSQVRVDIGVNQGFIAVEGPCPGRGFFVLIQPNDLPFLCGYLFGFNENPSGNIA